MVDDNTIRWARGTVLSLYVVFSLWFWFVCDDAYISFRYSKNLLHGYGFSFNPGEHAVEGYSNFAWVLLGVVVEAVGLSPAAVLPVVSVVCGAGLIALLFRLSDELKQNKLASLIGVSLFALSPPAFIWATGGLATMPFALAFVWACYELFVRERLHPTFAMLAVISLLFIRIEGGLWAGILLVVSALSRPEERRTLAPVAFGFAAVLLLYVFARIEIFGSYVPNTARVKVGFGPDQVSRGLKYVMLFALSTVTSVLGLIGSSQLKGRGAPIGAIVVAVWGWVVVVGGDFMPFGRLLMPALALGSLGSTAILERLPRLPLWGGLVVVGLLPAFDLHLVPEFGREVFHMRFSDKAFMSEIAKWKNMRENTVGFVQRGKVLKKVANPRDYLVTGAVGAVGYYSELGIYDTYGLVTPEVAFEAPTRATEASPGHDRKVDAEWFARYQPMYLHTRVVQGRMAAGRMKDTLEKWHVLPSAKTDYVPDFMEVTTADDVERVFLVMVRLADSSEDPDQMWKSFPARRKQLNKQLRGEP